jgi:hypothetical protein
MKESSVGEVQINHKWDADRNYDQPFINVKIHRPARQYPEQQANHAHPGGHRIPDQKKGINVE